MLPRVLIVGFALLMACSDSSEKKSANSEIFLKDFKPHSVLHVPVTEVKRARFPVIDIHNHVNDAREGNTRNPSDVVQIMDKANVEKLVILTGGWGEKLQKILDTMVKPFPDRFIVFTQIDWTRIGEADFSAKMVAQLRDAVRRGARGLKVLKKLGLTVRDPSGALLAVDDPRLDPIWAECGKLGIPVAIHVSDPEAFFLPLDNRNERYEELSAHPDWHFPAEKYPTKKELLDARDRMFAKHPRTTFIALHIANWPENLDYVAQLLEKYPNVYVEFGARQGELGRQPRAAYRFFLKFPGRILFGTDAGPSLEMYRNHFRWLETDDDYLKYHYYPGQGRWRIYGLKLPDPVLEEVYNQNARRIFKQFKGSGT